MIDIIESNIFTIIVILSLCYLIYREIYIFSSGFSLYKNSTQNNNEFSIVHIICSIDFFRSLIFGCDTVLGVLITKQILQNLSLPCNGFMLSIPLVTFGIGSIITLPVFQILTYKISIKKIYGVCFIGLFVSLVMLIISVRFNDFIVYCIAKFIFGFSIILFLATNHTVPMCHRDEKVRFKAFRGFSMTDISGAVIAIIISCEVAEYWGYEYIYLIALVFVIIVSILVFVFLNAKTCFPARENAISSDIKTFIKVIFSLPMIACLFVSFVSYTTGIYKTFVFSLLGEDFELSQISISYVASLSLIVVYILSRLYDKVTKNFEHWTLTCICLFATSLVFMMFIFLNNLFWACLTLILSGVLYKSLFVEVRMLSPRHCIKHKVEPSKIQPIFDFIDSISCTIRAPFLGFFMIFGNIGPCIAIGVLSLVCLVVFILFTFKSSIRKIK